MYKTDIERIAAEGRQIQRLAEELLNDSEALAEEGVDTSTAPTLDAKQQRLQDEMEQAILDLELLLERSDGVGDRPTYEPPRQSFELTWDSAAEEMTIEYVGGVEMAANSISVYRDGEELNSKFPDPTTTGETVTVDTSSMPDEGVVSVEWEATDTGKGRHTLPNGKRSPVSKDNLPSESSLVPEATTLRAAEQIRR